MTQNELNREVARATGETVTTVKRLGFILDDPSSRPQDADFADLGPHVIDWDDFDVERSQPPDGRSHREPALA